MINIRQSSRGFSLVELVVSMSVLGIIAAIAITALGKVKTSAHKSQDASNLRQIAITVLNYHTEHGVLPGRLNRAVRIPDDVLDANRHKWFSTFMIDRGYLDEDDRLWFPSSEYGIEESGHNYVLNNTIHSLPSNFFGRRSSNAQKNTEPLSIHQLQSNLSAVAPQYEPLPSIWMITNADSINYGSASTAGSQYAVDGEILTPWGGRNYAFFDGRVAFLTPDKYPSRD